MSFRNKNHRPAPPLAFGRSAFGVCTDADKAKNVTCVKRGKRKGFSGVENALFVLDNTCMLYGDGQAVAGKLIAEFIQL